MTERDGSIIAEANGIRARLNPNPDVATLPDEKVWQMIMPNGKTWCGDEDIVLRIMGDESMAGWRKRYGGCIS